MQQTSAVSKTGSAGVVATLHRQVATPADPLILASGDQLVDVNVAYETYGTLNADASNAIFICHALTGDAHAAGTHATSGKVGWWDNLIGPGKPVDTNRWFVVCPNLLGGCQGTTGPSSVDPSTGAPYGLRFPLLAMSDFVEVHRRLADGLGISSWAAVIGGSLGGMQVLEWALRYSSRSAQPDHHRSIEQTDGAEHRLQRGRKTVDHAGPRFRGWGLPSAGDRPGGWAFCCSNAGSHHLPVGDGISGEVR